jgi:hypothetical protein
MENSQQPRLSGREYSGFIVTNTLKLVGGVLGMSEAFLHDEVRPLVMGFAALLIAGGQGIEAFLTSFFGVRR